MGAWGTGPFDNDSAADWAGELTEATPQERSRLLRRTLQAVLLHGDSGVELDASSEEDWGAEEAITAAAVIASALPGGPTVDETYGPTLQVIASLQVDEQLRALVLRAVQGATSEGSEWHDLWSEADALNDALRALQPVISALRHS
ncbi:MAG: DUF4259 domain-containing protein [Alphaproteobacteria bacterium]|nr:MAG: DUF4259 domain-containing protein [Alphaproteobacteria bacterium]